MMTLALSIPGPTQLLNILIVAIGLGMVIFFHELGHFLVAKWCNVYVERFSIGFGRPIIRRQWGETEYVLAWLPFGGYVKMMGQDDMDPAQMTDEHVAENPRSYTAKSVPQRMAIISAGVIMNIITGTIFFMLVFHWGIMQPDRVIGVTYAGLPAWEYGIRSGDTITEINGRQVKDFNDIRRRTALSHGEMKIRGKHANGETFEVTLDPKKEDEEILKMIGVAPAASLKLISEQDADKIQPTLPGTAAAKAGFQYSDKIISVAGQDVQDIWQVQEILAGNRAVPVEVKVERKGSQNEVKQATLTLPPEQFLDFGLRMNIGQLSALRQGDLAEKAGMRLGDQIAKVDGQDVGSQLNPMKLSDYFSEHAGQEVTVTVTRRGNNGPPETVDLKIKPDAANPWSEPPQFKKLPVSIPSIGAAFDVVPVIFSVEPDGPADKAKLSKRDTITRVAFSRLSKDAPPDLLGKEDAYVITINEKDKNWAHAFWTMQSVGRGRKITLTVKGADGTTEREVEITPQPVADWYLPTSRGLLLENREIELRADDLKSAASMGATYTLNSMEDIYLTLRGLFTREISPLGLSGPIDIARTAYRFADVGLTHFLLFLGLISVNLAVINFLPIPVLDGGHMVFLLWEGIFRRKPSERVVATATYFGLALVLSLMVFVIILDLFVKRG